MRIAVNTRLLIKDRVDGFGRFASETLYHLTRNHPDVEFIFLFDRPFDKSFIFSENITPLVIPPPTRHPMLYKIWFDFMLPLVFKRYKPHIFFSPDGFLSLNTKITQLPVIHDLNFIHQALERKNYSKMYEQNFPRYAQIAKRIITVSEYSKQDIVNQYKVSPELIDVVYCGASEFFKPVNELAKTATKNKYAEGSDYFVFIGSIYKRKNLETLFKAFEQFKSNTGCSFKLLIAGTKIDWSASLDNIFNSLKCKNDIVFTGRLKDNELKNVLAAAYAITFVSLFEGFGIPLVEAMQCDVPVIASNTTSMPEVAGNAALLVNPLSIEDIALAMHTITTRHELREQLIKNGRTQRLKFTYQKTAQLVWQSLQKCF